MIKTIQNCFNGGELSPSLHARSDLRAYYSGCALAKNLVVTREGALRKRRGIVSVADMVGPGDETAFPYRFDRTRAGVLLACKAQSEAGPYLFFVLIDKSGAEVATSETSAGFPDMPFEGDVRDLRCRQIGDEMWITGGGIFKIVTVNDFDLGAGGCTLSGRDWAPSEPPPACSSLSATPYNAGGGSPNPEAFTRSIYYAAHIVRGGILSNRRTASSPWASGWPAGSWISVSVGIPASVGDDFDYVLLCKKIGGSFGEVARWYPEDLRGGGGTISRSMSFRDENISPGAPVYAQTNVLGEGFAEPLCVDCFQQRRVLANAALVTTDGTGDGQVTAREGLPMTMWFSGVGDLGNFRAGRPATDADPFSPTIASTGPAFIRWVACWHDVMILFTDCGLFSVGFSQSAGFSASSCRISKFSAIPCSETVGPVATGAGVVFVGGDDKTLYTISFDLQDNALRPVNRSVLAGHLTETSRITSIGLQEYPGSVVWVVTEDGRACSFTYEKDEEVYAWARHEIEGASIRRVIPLGSVTDSSACASMSDVFFVVETPGGVFLCGFDSPADRAPGHRDVIGGLSVPVRAELTTLRAESRDGTLAGLRKNVKDALIRLKGSGAVKVRPASGGEGIPLAETRAAGGGLFTGDARVMPRGLVDESGQMTFVSDDDSPCEILAVAQKVEFTQ